MDRISVEYDRFPEYCDNLLSYVREGNEVVIRIDGKETAVLAPVLSSAAFLTDALTGILKPQPEEE